MLPTGAFTEYLDAAQVALYVFWFFFAALIIYLVREGKREGYPLEAERLDRKDRTLGNFPPIPKPKTYHLRDGSKVLAPDPARADNRPVNATPMEDYPGTAYEPNGNPMLAAVGPGSYAERADKPDLTFEGDVKIVPLRVAGAFGLDDGDADPRGMSVVGADGEVAGAVKDVWIDRSEYMARYLEVDLGGSARQVLLPITFAKVHGKRGVIEVDALLAAQFAEVPQLASPEQVTLLEEDKITAYYGAGTLYATPRRRETII